MPIPTNHEKPARQSAKESAFSQIQQWIIDGTLLPGEKLNDAELAKALGVSRTPIRESLQLLEVQDFVKMYPGKATEVTEVDKESINDLLPPLASLQALSAEHDTVQLSDETDIVLEETNARSEQPIRSDAYFSALRTDVVFHLVTAVTAGPSNTDHMLAYSQAHVRRMVVHTSNMRTTCSI